MYSKEDDNGISYIFAGVNPNNWVKLGNIYFRIIRFNENGSMRLIYSGENSPETSGAKTIIETSKFNEQFYDNAYVGYMYGKYNADSYDETHANINDSIIKKEIDNWYKEELIKYEEIFDTNAGFCNNRDLEEEDKEYIGIAQITTYYNNFYRYFDHDASINIGGGGVITGDLPLSPTIPNLSCPEHDLFTTFDSYHGNKSLTYPVGTITADELVLAGGFFHIPVNFWLNTNQGYWTMTPFIIAGENNSLMAYLDEEGMLNYTLFYDEDANPIETKGIRPVINLKSTTTFQNNNADGSIEKPYVVQL